jgi:hypothetical protein
MPRRPRGQATGTLSSGRGRPSSHAGQVNRTTATAEACFDWILPAPSSGSVCS